MLDEVLANFDVKTDYDLNIMILRQDMYNVTVRVITGKHELSSL